MNNKKVFLNSLSGLSSAVQILKLTTIVLFIAVIFLSISLFKAINKQQIFIKVNEEGKAIPTEILNENAINLIRYQQFITDFLERAYCWTPKTFQKQIKSAMPLMEEQAQRFFEQELKQNKTFDLIVQNSIANILVVKYIDKNSLQPTEEGWTINVDAIKLRLIEIGNAEGIFSSKPIPVRFTVGFKTCPLSADNIWGFKVYYLDEEEILS